MKRIRKSHVEKKLEAMGYDRVHTLRKGWVVVGMLNRNGWSIATLHGWKHLGHTLAAVMNTLEIETELREWEQPSPATIERDIELYENYLAEVERQEQNS